MSYTNIYGIASRHFHESKLSKWDHTVAHYSVYICGVCIFDQYMQCNMGE